MQKLYVCVVSFPKVILLCGKVQLLVSEMKFIAYEAYRNDGLLELSIKNVSFYCILVSISVG